MGLIPKITAIGKNIGVVINITGSLSITQPMPSIKATIKNKKAVGLVVRDKNQAAIKPVTWWRASNQPKGVVAPINNSETAEVTPVNT